MGLPVESWSKKYCPCTEWLKMSLDLSILWTVRIWRKDSGDLQQKNAYNPFFFQERQNQDNPGVPPKYNLMQSRNNRPATSKYTGLSLSLLFFPRGWPSALTTPPLPDAFLTARPAHRPPGAWNQPHPRQRRPPRREPGGCSPGNAPASGHRVPRAPSRTIPSPAPSGRHHGWEGEAGSGSQLSCA